MAVDVVIGTIVTVLAAFEVWLARGASIADPQGGSTNAGSGATALSITAPA